MQGWWRQRAPREQTLLALGLALVLLALLWMLALAPALKTLGQHDSRMAVLQAELARMQALEAQAQQLKTQSAPGGGNAPQALQAQTRTLLGQQAELALRSGGASATLHAVSPQALGRWLAAIRTEAHAKVLQARLQRTAEGWSGSVQLTLPE